MNSTLTSILILKLIDQVTGPSNRAAQALRSFKNTADGIGGSTSGLSKAAGHLRAAADAHRKTFDSLKGEFVRAAASAAAVGAAIAIPVKAAMNFQTTMADIGTKIDQNLEKVTQLGEKIRKSTRGLGQSPQEMAMGIDTFVGLGVNEQDALTMSVPVAKAATAYRAAVSDLAKAGTAALQNLKIPADQFSKALDVMAQAGKAGAFELKDMAQYIPSLAAAYQALEQTGVPALADLAAALEVVRKGTGDSSSAATNLFNVLQKIQSPETIGNFKKFGINIQKRIDIAQKNGTSPLDALIKATLEATKGDLDKIGFLFGDSQAQQGLRALIQNYEEFQKIRDAAGKASGVVDRDFEMRMETMQSKLDNLAASWSSLMIALGNALTPAAAAVLDAITPAVQAMDDFITAHPDLAAGVAIAAAGYAALAVALSGVRLALAGMQLATLAGLSTMATTSPKVGGWLGLAMGIAAVALALKAIDEYSPAAMKVLEDWRAGDKSKPLQYSVPGNRGLIGMDVAAKAGAVFREWIIEWFKGTGKQSSVDLPQLKVASSGQSVAGGKGDRLVGLGRDPRIIQPGKTLSETKPEISLLGAQGAQREVGDLKSNLLELGGITVSPGISVKGLQNALSLILRIKDELNSPTFPSAYVRGAHADVGAGGGSGW